MLCVSVMAGCLVLDTAPQGKRGVGITSNTHRSFLFGQGAGVVHLPRRRRRRRLPLGRARVLYVERWRTLRDFCVSVWWWGAWSSTQRRRGRGGGISSNTHRSCFLRTAAMLPWSPVASLLCVSVVVGCLVLDTAPQGKREGGGWASPATLTAHCALGLGWYSCCVVSYIAVP